MYVHCAIKEGPGGCTLDRPKPAEGTRQMDESILSPEILRKILRYEPETGRLFWLRRDVEFFEDGKHSAHHTCAKWNGTYAATEAFTANDGVGYKRSTIFGKQYRAHRVGWCIAFGYWPEQQIDHINGDRSDNRLCNLREASNAQNQHNRKSMRGSSSEYLGVCWSSACQKWAARIRHGEKNVHIGIFQCEHDAALAYNFVASEIRGEFARMNVAGVAK
jgi:hypothetical protein